MFLQKLSILTVAKFTISTRTDIALQRSVKKVRAITMCSAFSSGSGYEYSKINLKGDVYCPNTKCSGKIYLHKKIFLGRSHYQCPQCASVSQVRNIPFEDQTSSFFIVWPRGYIFEESPASVQEFIGGIFCPGKFCFNSEECESFDSHVTTPRSIYGCGKCGACLFVQKVFLRYKST